MKTRIFLAGAICWVFALSLLGLSWTMTVQPIKDIWSPMGLVFMVSLGVVLAIAAAGLALLANFVIVGLKSGVNLVDVQAPSDADQCPASAKWYLGRRLLVTAPQGVAVREDGNRVILTVNSPCEIYVGVEPLPSTNEVDMVRTS